MKWRQFSNEGDAQAYCNQQTASMNLPAGDVTTVWASPAALADGTYVVPAYLDNEAVPWDASWEIAQL
jgi:hypothetical protein